MKIYHKYLYLFLLGVTLCCVTGISAQSLRMKMQAADKEYANLKYTQAITLYQKIVRKNTDNAYAIGKIADCYWRMRDFNNALSWYEKLNAKSLDSITMAGYIHVLMANGKYKQAQDRCKEYIALHAGEKKIGGLLQHLENLDLFFRDSANWRTSFVDINSDAEDFCPVFYNKGLVFVSNRSKNDRVKKRSSHSIGVPAFCKIYYIGDTKNIKILSGYQPPNLSESKTEPVLWEDALPGAKIKKSNTTSASILDMGIKTHLNIGPVTFSSDGKTAYYNWNARIQKKDGGVSRLELFSTSYINGSFTGEKGFQYNGTDYSVEHPSLSADGQFLYFSSNRKGGLGAFDIYSCKKNDSSWSTPKNLGKLVNTDGNEMFPFADAQGNLYFASDGWPGLGALDIFYVKMKNGMPVGPPQNLGYPVNSSYDDFGITVAADSASGYFSSNRRDGNDDIYRFAYLKDINENIKVTVLDTVSRLRTDGVVVNRKEEKETINNWSFYVNGPAYLNSATSDSASRIWVNGALVNKLEGKPIEFNRLVYVIGTVLDSITKLRMDGVTIDIHETGDEGNDNFHFVTNNSGNFGAYWKNESRLEVQLKKPGYHTYHVQVQTDQLRDHFLLAFLKPGEDPSSTEKKAIRKIVSKNIMAPIAAPSSMAFEENLRHLTDSLHVSVIKRFSVYYDLGSFNIRQQDVVIMDSVVKIVKDHPEINVVVAGFTDCRGDSIVNRQLAKNRAGAVRRFLQKLGIHPSGINTAYFSKKNFVLPCKEDRTYDKNKQMVNRRSEIVLVQNGNFIAQNQDKESDRINVAIVAEKNKRNQKTDTSKSISPIKDRQNKVNTEVKVVNNSGSTLPQLAAAKESSNRYAEKKVIVTEIKDKKNKVITEEKKENNSGNVLPQLGTPKDSSNRYTEKKVIVTGIKDRQNKVNTEEKGVNNSGTTLSQKVTLKDSSDIYSPTSKRVVDSDTFSTQRKEEDLIAEMSKRISKTPILLHTTSDSVHIELYDNGVFDRDTISIIYNGKLLIFKQQLQVDKAISFYVKVDGDERKNEMIFFADNLGLIPPNSALMVITDGEAKRTEVSVTNDLGHNAVIYFIKPKKKADN